MSSRNIEGLYRAETFQLWCTLTYLMFKEPRLRISFVLLLQKIHGTVSTMEHMLFGVTGVCVPGPWCLSHSTLWEAVVRQVVSSPERLNFTSSCWLYFVYKCRQIGQHCSLVGIETVPDVQYHHEALADKQLIPKSKKDATLYVHSGKLGPRKGCDSFILTSQKRIYSGTKYGWDVPWAC